MNSPADGLSTTNMQVMILAAGRGERMRPLTDKTPKPLLKINDKAIIIYLIEALAKAGLTELVINYAHLGEQIVQLLGDGQEWGVHIQYSAETSGGLETGGGIFNALPLLKSDPFIIVNADIWTDFSFTGLPHDIDGQAHLVLVDNPSHHAEGDFCLQDGVVLENGADKLTYSGIAVLKHSLFAHSKAGIFPLAPLFRDAMTKKRVTGEYYLGGWQDIGTPERLQALNNKTVK
jgi:MurNAc alpha-1-phosphate uridylyltransferase